MQVTTAIKRTLRVALCGLLGLIAVAHDGHADERPESVDASPPVLVGAHTFVCLRDGDTLRCEGRLLTVPQGPIGSMPLEQGEVRWQWHVEGIGDDLRAAGNLVCARANGVIRCGGEAEVTGFEMSAEVSHAVSCGDSWWVSTTGFLCQLCQDHLVCERPFEDGVNAVELDAPTHPAEVVGIATTDPRYTSLTWIAVVYDDGRVDYGHGDTDAIVDTLDTGLERAVTLGRDGTGAGRNWVCGVDAQGRVACANLLRCVRRQRKGVLDPAELPGWPRRLCEPALQPWTVALPDDFSPRRIRLDEGKGCVEGSDGEVRCWHRPRGDAYDVPMESTAVTFTHHGSPDELAVTSRSVCALFGDEFECVDLP